MYNIDDVIAKVQAHRAATKASLSGMERMQYNLRWKLRNWILRETDRRCVCVGEVVDKVRKYAPKAILRNREQFERAVEDIWSIAHDYGIDSDDMLREDLKDYMDSEFGKATEGDASEKKEQRYNTYVGHIDTQIDVKGYDAAKEALCKLVDGLFYEHRIRIRVWGVCESQRHPVDGSEPTDTPPAESTDPSPAGAGMYSRDIS
ncbi:MAG: hypothetical protein ACK5KN_07600 [Dysgonomonas sp.]|uniref:hypothetical protein n=1 Tax=Dysgonomonas sp. TaxID=1891233 RepID=UPI003A8717F9